MRIDRTQQITQKEAGAFQYANQQRVKTCVILRDLGAQFVDACTDLFFSDQRGEIWITEFRRELRRRSSQVVLLLLQVLVEQDVCLCAAWCDILCKLFLQVNA